VFGLVFLVAGTRTLLGGVQGLVQVVGQHSSQFYSQRDTLYVLVWVIFSASLIIAGVSLLGASYRARRHNMVPGPTLYVAGASLMVIAFFLVAAHALLPAIAAAIIATSLMIAEYSSEHI
ncbi:MAG: hypothetical protein AB8G17_01830, partial [Gammaproteobacteria bacterium]